ncbi:uncharacterized protein PHALS_08048 [Plasmopara halstedii]|uniref:Uncharacterized protein n=1 Tax=Plasmopara halstedii TaxID=4781 RepID=A0A0P1B7J8_PLAHL|nr:uncharacterized protein PHALS_08048 [Plasmopara halstedii]CEG50329.1 hypothetical protein PHALS_08048 [Plasmopara halstedii]|eukprot:XP_024586698.1 hypothetical protein PHALS_08048 [Plasmopara halstedii]
MEPIVADLIDNHWCRQRLDRSPYLQSNINHTAALQLHLAGLIDGVSILRSVFRRSILPRPRL